MKTLQTFAYAGSLLALMISIADAQSPHEESNLWQFNNSVEIRGPLTLSNSTGATFKYSTDAGIRMTWDPLKKSFRAGQVPSNSNVWESGSIGLNSFAVGYNTLASETASNAFGWNTQAIGTAAFAAGNWTKSIGNYSSGFGSYTRAEGGFSLAMGFTTRAVGICSLATGAYTVANGLYSTSMGYYTAAQAYGSLVIGQFNVIEGNPLQSVASNPLFVVGNGENGSPSNALTVYKSGKITMKRQGDILMGEFGNPGD